MEIISAGSRPIREELAGQPVHQKPQSNWQSKYRKRIALLDAVIIVWAVAGAFIVRFGIDLELTRKPIMAHASLAVALSLAWWLVLTALGTRDPKVLGTGAEEYRGVVRGSIGLFGLVAILSYALKFDTARGFVGIALPVGTFALIMGRYMMRQLLGLDRVHGESSSRVLIVGNLRAAEHLVSSLRKSPRAGYLPVAAYVVDGQSPEMPERGSFQFVVAPVDVSRILETIESSGADTVAISTGSNIPPRTLRELSWILAARQIRLILAPALTDVAGPRIHTQPVAGLPLIHVSTPKLTGAAWITKRVFDIFGSATLIVVSSPVFLLIAILIRTTSKGPILYSQERIGIRGASFKMYKFRSMKQDADRDLSTLLEAQGTSDQPLFKITDDPRITSVGKVLRKYSLDELPQLFNVLLGSMSLVGPRPQREAEVALYDESAHRRLYVSPGMSGLWQVSGRSSLTWDEAIQLDLYYVENWSLTQDVVILLKTFRAVIASDGAV